MFELVTVKFGADELENYFCRLLTLPQSFTTLANADSLIEASQVIRA